MGSTPIFFSGNQSISREQFRNELDAVSPSFCAAKWKQVTVHLQNGLTHSCHHPVPHKIPLKELQLNPSALHNTEFKKQQRKLMLQGKRPAECDYCWRVEDSNSKSISDRIIKSQTDWAEPFINDIINRPWDNDVLPSYLEVSFGNTCNLKCSYCSPQFSSKWSEESEKYGGYPTSTNFNNLEHLKKNDLIPISHRDHNPYVEAFWKWWPKAYPNLSQFRITGGEPLLNKNTFQVFDYILEKSNPHLTLAINSNLCVQDHVLELAIERLKKILGEGQVKKVELYTSAEAHGPQAEYIRFGMNYNLWLNNIQRLCREVPQLELIVMSTYNVLSLTSYIPFLKDLLAIKRDYGHNFNYRTAIHLDIPYLREPKHQSVFILDREMLTFIFNQILFIDSHMEGTHSNGTKKFGFSSTELDNLKRIYNVTTAALEKPTAKQNTARKDFAIFVDEHDRRRGTHFLNTFPELEKFYQSCKALT
ncbi:MAG: twitch domain-containing radical SAM protein [Bdellovibrionales bacterium]|nr:twitch domain-containing radical SAM protein [Bdellovibrionales bacterium]